MLDGKNIVLGVSGSIAAYKSAELVRELRKRGANVFVVFSTHAKDFVSPLTLQALSGHPVTDDLFNAAEEAVMGHIRLAEVADAVLVAPASANILAKAACGLADDALSATLLATNAPVMFAPSMNVQMWENAVTQRNVETLRGLGRTIIAPENGELACGTVGAGRLAELSVIVDATEALFSRKDMIGVEVIVTAGPTREFLDPIRFLSNISSGKMGYAIAKVAHDRGANVTLISGPTALERPTGVKVKEIETASELRETLQQTFAEARSEKQLLFMAAAVSDHRAAQIASEKLSFEKSKDISMKLTPNVDILAEIGAGRKAGRVCCTLVGFAAETSGDEKELLEKGRQKLERKQVDLIVANLAAESFGKDDNHVFLVWRSGSRELKQRKKELVANEVISAALSIR